ncbi:uncharacterized protein LOC124684366 [Lolium rigidum]|uniref:uncharacterized protein LOC124684366 n=1 Tax=Lolium rigidum TaxID=89674 RepID=UPI001F5D4319|nr:uncharacterized protein LOC124684366 [Lolium rigidum]
MLEQLRVLTDQLQGSSMEQLVADLATTVVSMLLVGPLLREGSRARPVGVFLCGALAALCSPLTSLKPERVPLSCFLAMDDLQHELSRMNTLAGITVKFRVKRKEEWICWTSQ